MKANLRLKNVAIMLKVNTLVIHKHKPNIIYSVSYLVLSDIYLFLYGNILPVLGHVSLNYFHNGLSIMHMKQLGRGVKITIKEITISENKIMI